MADLELFKFEGPDPRDASVGLSYKQRVLEVCSGGGETLDPGGGEGPWTELQSAARPEEETETSFTCKHGGDGDTVQLRGTQTCTQTHCSSLYEEEEEEVMEEEEEEEEDIPELFLLSDDDLSSEGSGKSVDYGFITAVTCLVTGISLVAISYTVPRDVRVDPDTVSAREMERLEREKSRVGAHLDRCVIAGLCLLTLGGVLLSTLLMVSMWKGEMMRRKAFAYSKHAANLYGSISLRAASSPTRDSGSRLSAADEDLEVLS
ncbi:transmembrane protein 74 [Paralichthys olivaceus]|uniref:transmembrane protein 74 n=1 Tax=Paralichthys olivaceus TaxID=8255 RepID=UPI00375061F0